MMTETDVLKADGGRHVQIPQSAATFGTSGQKADDSTSSHPPHPIYPVNGRQLSAVIGEFKTATPH